MPFGGFSTLVAVSSGTALHRGRTQLFNPGWQVRVAAPERAALHRGELGAAGTTSAVNVAALVGWPFIEATGRLRRAPRGPCRRS